MLVSRTGSVSGAHAAEGPGESWRRSDVHPSSHPFGILSCRSPRTCRPTERLSENDVQAIDHLRDAYARLRKELGRVIVGQHDVIERLAICLFARGHALLMGVPGLAKTLMVNKLAETMSLKFSRIQFTPDLMPMDITGTDILQDAAGRPARVPVRPRAGLRQHRAGRRDQPRPAEDPGGACSRRCRSRTSP